MDDFERAKDKIVMGAERRSMVMPEEERRNTAYHESGHAVVAKLLPKTDPVHKVTIIPRGRALGVTMQLPEQDRYSMDRDRLLSSIAVLFGGRIAEELFMGQMTTGASNDFERATALARSMVTQWGMSDAMGPMVYGENEGEVFLGRSITTHKNVSEVTMQKVDAEIRRIIDEQFGLAKKLILDNRDKGGARRGRACTRLLAHSRERDPKPASGLFMSAAVAARSLRCGRFRLMLDRPLVAGVVNVTPDSFSDGGHYLEPSAAIAHARRLADEGADLIDLGAESSRPGAESVSAEQELSRLIPVLDGLGAFPIPISVDTTKPEVMRAVIGAGAAMINDIGALRSPGALEAVAASDAGVCLMHKQGEPRTMQLEPHNFELLRNLHRFAEMGLPVMAGWSRKSTLGAITGRGADERLAASIAAALLAVQHGATIVRVHDVAATRDALAVLAAMDGHGGRGRP